MTMLPCAVSVLRTGVTRVKEHRGVGHAVVESVSLMKTECDLLPYEQSKESWLEVTMGTFLNLILLIMYT